MAQIEDYLKNDTLDAEVEQAASAAADRKTTFNMPTQFQGKSAEEIAQSFVELQTLNSRQAQELGDTRKTVSALTASLSIESNSQQEAESRHTVTVDEIYDDPTSAIEGIVNSRVSKELEGIKKVLADRDSEDRVRAFEADYPTYKEDGQSPKMQEFIKATTYRQNMAARADQGDLQAAAELFDLYYDLTGAENQRQEHSNRQATRQRQLADASLESGATTMHPPSETFSRAELTNYRVMAKRGNQQAQTFLDKNRDAIRGAYEAGHLVD